MKERPEDKECKWPLEAEEGKEILIYSPLEHSEGIQPWQHLDLLSYRNVR